ncbi:hypothetical protein A2U01_0027169, partial [Trifolium medium]|nr:hypothetical protein [Trifolium medium]
MHALDVKGDEVGLNCEEKEELRALFFSGYVLIKIELYWKQRNAIHNLVVEGNQVEGVHGI